MSTYKVLVSTEFFQAERISRLSRDRILAFIESLAGNPNDLGDFSERDEVGRLVQIKIIADHALT